MDSINVFHSAAIDNFIYRDYGANQVIYDTGYSGNGNNNVDTYTLQSDSGHSRDPLH